ncbi:hypothetical protein ABW21_db0205181 [Orbilia brochopaga]|nr:hypothetical protein ABW21_db0205181 [Drechslerella brochopaga]
MMEEFTVPMQFENRWSFVFGNQDEITDYTENLRKSLVGSVLVENEDDFVGQRAAFLEAYGTLINAGRMSKLSMAKVHAALYVANKPTDSNNIPGNFRLVQAFIGNSLTANIFETERALEELSEYFNDRCVPLEDRSLKYASCVLHFYKSYELIHPFTDGNGRTGRAWVNAMLLWKLLPPLYFKDEWLKTPIVYHSLFHEGNDEQYLGEHIESILANDLD